MVKPARHECVQIWVKARLAVTKNAIPGSAEGPHYSKPGSLKAGPPRNPPTQGRKSPNYIKENNNNWVVDPVKVLEEGIIAVGLVFVPEITIPVVFAWAAAAG